MKVPEVKGVILSDVPAGLNFSTFLARLELDPNADDFGSTIMFHNQRCNFVGYDPEENIAHLRIMTNDVNSAIVVRDPYRTSIIELK